jgi:hypothetical protein
LDILIGKLLDLELEKEGKIHENKFNKRAISTLLLWGFFFMILRLK